MKTLKIVYSPSAEISVTTWELVVLFVCSRLHYDAYCREQCEEGGTIWGLLSRTMALPETISIDQKLHMPIFGDRPIEPSTKRMDDVIQVTLSFQEIDLLRKITEVGSRISNTSIVKTADTLNTEMGLILNELNSAYRNVNRVDGVLTPMRS